MQRLNHDERSPVEIINDSLCPAGQSGSTGRCGFDCLAQFNQTAPKPSALPSTHLSRNKVPLLRDRNQHDHEQFRTTFKSPLQLDLKIESATKNVAGMAPYAPPSMHDFRSTSTESELEADFRTKFSLPSNQDLRRQVARDQEGFLNGASIKNVTCDRYDPRADGKEDFHLQLPHTSSKTGNLNLRLQVTLDQAGLFNGGQAVREHKYRQEGEGSEDHRFVLEFKPKGKGYGCKDIGTLDS